MIFMDKLMPYMEGVLRKFSCTMLIPTKVGIKPMNQIMNSDHFNEVIIESVTNLKFEQFIAPPDFLKDKYTLIGKNISEWPHYTLIKYLDNNLPLGDCDYFKRNLNGTLDFRKKMKLSTEWFKGCYQERLKTMKMNEIFTIKAYLVYDNIYTIADGKHSLAMAYYFDYHNLRFDIIPNIDFETYHRWIFEKIRNDKDFMKHNDFFRRSYEYKRKEIDKIIENGFIK